MNKKFFISIALLLIAVVLCGCTNQMTLEVVNAMANVEYSRVELTVETTLDGQKLTSNYKTSKNGEVSTVNYSIEKLSSFGVDEYGNYVIPEDYKTTLTGSFTVENGKTEGDVVTDLDLSLVSAYGLLFAENTLSDVQFNGNVMTATVSDPAAFVGRTDFVATDMKLSVTVTELTFSAMTVSYTAFDGAIVKLNYLFVL